MQTHQIAHNPEHMTGVPCRIILKGEMSDRFAPVFCGLSLHHRSGRTELRGMLVDQSQLQSLLNRLFDLGMQVVSVTTEPGSEGVSA